VNQPAIVIIAYNRPKALKQLLDSVNNAIYPDGPIELIISIDKGNNKEVGALAKAFDWQHGNKEIIYQEEHLGLINHVFFCAGMTRKYETIVLLEDDLIVSSHFYTFSEKTSEYYQNEEKIAGISLYNYCLSESSLLSFLPVDDGSDVYFMQYPSSWGLCLTHKNWQLFLKSYIDGELSDTQNDPCFVKSWPRNSWKRFMIRYLCKYNKYFVFPRLSLTSNFSYKGTNTPLDLNIFQVALQMSHKNYIFNQIKDSKAVYDAYFEISPESLNRFVNNFSTFNYVVDLQGVRSLNNTNANYVLTTRKTKSPLMTFGSPLKPLILNVINNIRGADISFDLIENTSRKTNHVHYGHTEFIHKYLHQNLSNKFSFFKYFYLYLSYEMKMYWQKLFS